MDRSVAAAGTKQRVWKSTHTAWPSFFFVVCRNFIDKTLTLYGIPTLYTNKYLINALCLCIKLNKKNYLIHKIATTGEEKCKKRLTVF